MKNFKFYQVDAFTDRLFSGNPAAVCLLNKWLDDDVMQAISNENNLAETAFLVPRETDFEIRWFTPTMEVDLCGHATLASAYVIFNLLNYKGESIKFHTSHCGELIVTKDNNMFHMDFPTDTIEKLTNEMHETIRECIDISPIELYKGKDDYIAVINSISDLQAIQPNLKAIAKLKSRGLIVTAKGESVDFSSRYFAPQSGINEDPVTGSAHTSLMPIWSKKLGKKRLIANQLSARGGFLLCEINDNRCMIGGSARLYSTGEFYLD